MAAKNKAAALQHMKRKARYDKQRTQVEGQAETLHSQVHAHTHTLSLSLTHSFTLVSLLLSSSTISIEKMDAELDGNISTARLGREMILGIKMAYANFQTMQYI